ncbi:hypothetical protein LPJ66_010823 [Kickxella alabastrina]|uniref:Uncharacterized protein n=1 Tax=Kickxella alabastrina TaxID=61397 RepID=A0ACC1I2X6_9FUNG|nr:hypothetical protein LPJ66_010823 [Kickxella alabastrina]
MSPLSASANSPPLLSSFTTADIAVPAQPMALETIRVSSLKSHVKRRPSLREGRPLSGIVWPQPTASTPTESLTQLRVDMAGLVSRKIERQDNGRRALMRRWKDTYLVLSGSRLYFFRPESAANHSAHAAQAIQAIVPLRHGVAIVDSKYKKYPHVFRVMADDGSLILIKAANDDAVAEWMARINCAAAFKTMDLARREKPIIPDPARARLLEEHLTALDAQLSEIDDGLERSLRLFKQLAAMVPLTKAGRTKIVVFADQVRNKLAEIYLSEQRLTCYKDVLHLDLTIEYELSAGPDNGWDSEDDSQSDWDHDEANLEDIEEIDEEDEEDAYSALAQDRRNISTWDIDSPNTSSHPYYPQSLVLDGFVAPTQSPATLLAAISTLIALLLLSTYLLLITKRPNLSLADRLTTLWFVLCASLHCLFELYYLAHFSSLASTPDFVASLWKEYAKSDSRYLAQVPLVFALEFITVSVTGPLCLLTAWFVWCGGCARHICQLAACLLHLYSVVLYFGTEFMAKESNCRPEPVYYYVYLIAMNLPWVLVPLGLAVQSTKEIYTGMLVAKRATASLNVKA